MIQINKELLADLHQKAIENERLRMNLDMRTSPADTSQRMLNALEPGTKVPIHQHLNTAETVICLEGKIEEVFYEQVVSAVELGDSRCIDIARKVEFKEIARVTLCPREGKYGVQVPKGIFHTVEVFEPSVIFEAKDGKYGEDSKMSTANSLSDLKQSVEYLIGKERAEGNLEELTAEYIGKVLDADVNEVREVMKEIL